MITEIITERLHEHPAVRALNRLQSRYSQPETIEILKRKRKTCVYRLNGVGPGGCSIIAKKCREATAEVERLIYEEVLPRLPVPSLRCYGFLEDPDPSYSWLFIEDAAGEAYSPQVAEHRALAGRSLAELHLQKLPASLTARLPFRGSDYYLQLLRSSRRTLLNHMDNAEVPGDELLLMKVIVKGFDCMEAHWTELEKSFEGQQHTLVHGDFVKKNLRIRSGAVGSDLFIFDWEFGGWGVPAADLAQFVGRCASPDLDSYYSVLKSHGSGLEVSEVRRLANYGSALRVLDAISWETSSMVDGSYRFMVTPLRTIRKYEPELEATLRALHWSEGD
jgi:aminoglycoside phosphotransferase (APT) family kinase protein